VLAGCSSVHGGATGGPRLVPWDGTVPAALRPPALTPAPPCQAARLAVVGAGFRFTAAISGGTGQVTVRNAGPRPCRLTGRPDVTVVGAAPAPVQRQEPLPARPPAFPAVAPPDSALLAVPPGGAVTLDVDWRNWCVPRAAGKPVPPRAIRITLPAGAGSVDAGYNAVPPCDTPTAPSTLGVRPFQPAPLPSTPPWTATAVQAAIQPLSGGKLTGRPGATVRFAVELRNPSAAPVPFPRCPLVVELLAPAGQPEAHQLNCAAAGSLPAGGALRFEMRVQVPAGAPTGDNGLFWQLDPTGGQGPQAVSRITVTP
jgi:hypothetical protein